MEIKEIYNELKPITPQKIVEKIAENLEKGKESEALKLLLYEHQYLLGANVLDKAYELVKDREFENEDKVLKSLMDCVVRYYVKPEGDVKNWYIEIYDRIRDDVVVNIDEEYSIENAIAEDFMGLCMKKIGKNDDAIKHFLTCDLISDEIIEEGEFPYKAYGFEWGGHANYNISRVIGDEELRLKHLRKAVKYRWNVINEKEEFYEDLTPYVNQWLKAEIDLVLFEGKELDVEKIVELVKNSYVYPYILAKYFEITGLENLSEEKKELFRDMAKEALNAYDEFRLKPVLSENHVNLLKKLANLR